MHTRKYRRSKEVSMDTEVRPGIREHDTTLTKRLRNKAVRTSKKRRTYGEERADMRQEQESNQSRAHDRQGIIGVVLVSGFGSLVGGKRSRGVM